jgi:hypothetical protein
MQSKHTKITYVGGWISLFLLLVMCLWSFSQSKRLHKSSIIEVYTCNIQLGKEYGFYPLTRNYRQIVLDDNEQENNKKFVIIYYKLKQLKANHDTINGIDIVFGEKCKFKNWVKTLDLFLKIKQKRFAPTSNHIYLAHIEDIPDQKFIDEILLCDLIRIPREIKVDRWKIMVNYFKEISSFLREYPFIFGLWLILGFMSVRKILR